MHAAAWATARRPVAGLALGFSLGFSLLASLLASGHRVLAEAGARPQVRSRYQAGKTVNDWGEEECEKTLPYVCNMSPAQKFIDHCFIPLSRRSAAQGRGLGLGLFATALALVATL
jgi:hypothetical protein